MAKMSRAAAAHTYKKNLVFRILVFYKKQPDSDGVHFFRSRILGAYYFLQTKLWRNLLGSRILCAYEYLSTKSSFSLLFCCSFLTFIYKVSFLPLFRCALDFQDLSQALPLLPLVRACLHACCILCAYSAHTLRIVRWRMFGKGPTQQSEDIVSIIIFNPYTI